MVIFIYDLVEINDDCVVFDDSVDDDTIKETPNKINVLLKDLATKGNEKIMIRLIFNIDLVMII